jgi:hypothetical protein
MDAKFRKILETAFHPATGDGEAQAAFHAARRMSASGGLAKLLGASPAPQVREVVRVVYREPHHTDSLAMSFKIAARWQHSFIEYIWRDAQSLGLKIEIRHCRCRDKTIDSGLDLKLEVFGGPNALRAWDRKVDSYIAHINNNAKPKPTTGVASDELQHKPGFWSKLKGLFTKE